MKSDKATVNQVLKKMRIAIDNDNVGFYRRKKNMETLSWFGITYREMLDIIYGLTFGEYIKGPEPDRDYPNGPPLWVFIYYFYSKRIYIKFSVNYEDESIPRLFIVSFHMNDS